MIEPLELSDDDLAKLLETFRLLAEEGNRFFFDCYIAIERESLRRVKTKEMSEYTEDDLGGAIVALTHILKETENIPDEGGERKTLKTLRNVACAEVQRRMQDRVLN